MRSFSKILRSILLSLIIIILGVYTFQTGFKTYRQIYRDMRFIVKNPSFSYDQKMRIYWWGVYDLLQFVNKHTPSNARIAIPPQHRPFLTSGNSGIVRKFIYPRIPVPNPLESIDTSGVDYVLITHGEWDDVPKKDYDWPKVFIPAEKVIYFDPATKREWSVSGDFDPFESRNVNAYGLIVLRNTNL